MEQSIGTIQIGLKNLLELLETRRLADAHLVAYTFINDSFEEESITYEQLCDNAIKLAAHIQQVTAQGDRVLLLFPPGRDYVTAFFACIYAGVTAVPLYPPRSNRNVQRVQSVINDAGISLILATEAVKDMSLKFSGQLAVLQQMNWITTDTLAGHEYDWHRPTTSCEDTVFIQYTSGTTGTPKGVVLSHTNLLHNLESIKVAFNVNSDSKAVVWLPPYHDMGLIGGILEPLYVGFPCVLMSPHTFVQTPTSWLQAISRHKATVSGAPNFAYDMCVDYISDEVMKELDLTSWKTAFMGAEPIRPRTIERFASTFESVGFHHDSFLPCYGLAESTLLVTSLPPQRDLNIVFPSDFGDLNSQRMNAPEVGVVGCGIPQLGQDVKIVNPETLEVCNDLDVGEIWVSGPSVASGYFNRPIETSETFMAYTANGFGPFLRTGDLGFLNKGQLFVSGRRKEMMIIRGANVYPQDVELTVEEAHEVLQRNASAAFVLDAREERMFIAIEVRRKHRKNQDWEGVFNAIRKSVAESHGLQLFGIAIVRPGGIPKTSSGKIQRAECRTLLLQGALPVIAEWNAEQTQIFDSCEEPLLDECHFEDRTGQIVQLLSQASGVHVDNIRLDTSLFSLGIDSLSATRLVHSIESQFGIRVSLMKLLEDISLRELTQYLSTLSANFDKIQPLVPIERDQHPLTNIEQSILMSHELLPATNNIVRAFTVRGDLDYRLLQECVQKLVNQHAALRTSFYFDDSNLPFKRIRTSDEVRLNIINTTSFSNVDIKALLNHEATYEFNLSDDPLYKITVIKNSHVDDVILFVFHHIIVDYWSLEILLAELIENYHNALRDGVCLNHDVQSDDMIVLRETYNNMGFIDRDKGTRLKAFWYNQLQPRYNRLSFAVPKTHASDDAVTSSHAFTISAKIVEGLKDLSQQNGTTVYVTLLAAFNILLSRYSGSYDIAVTSPVSNRLHSDVSRTVSCLINQVVIRSKLEGDLPFIKLLESVNDTVRQVLEHQEYPFKLLVSDNHIEPSALMQTMFTWYNSSTSSLQNAGRLAVGIDGSKIPLANECYLESIMLESLPNESDLVLAMADDVNSFVGVFTFKTSVLDKSTVQRMCTHFCILLESIVENPEELISKLPMLSGEEVQTITKDWNCTEGDVPSNICVHTLFERQVQQNPDRTAVVFEDKTMSFTQLNELSNRLAHKLIKMGIGPEMLVGVYMDRSLEMIVGLLGVLKAGAAYVPLDPQYPSERLAFVIEDSELSMILTQTKLMSHINGVTTTPVTCVDEKWENLQDEMNTNPTVEVQSNNLMYVIYTSGSTGQPKGVQVQHNNVVNLFYGVQKNVDCGTTDVVLAMTSISFDISVLELFWPLSRGASVVIASSRQLIDTDVLCDVIDRLNITILQATPSRIQMLLDFGWKNSLSLTVLVGGEPSPHQVILDLTRGGNGFWHCYGPTETTVWSSMEYVNQQNKEVVSIGRPILNTKIVILDNSLQLVPVGVLGEIFIGGAGVSRGYRHERHNTGRFISSVVELGAFYRTGDLGYYLPDGRIVHVGRVDNLVKFRGHRVELEEIEYEISRFSNVSNVTVCMMNRAGMDELVAFVVPSSFHAELNFSDLKLFLSRKLPRYMVPTAYEMIEKMPLTPNGKVDRKALEQAFGVPLSTSNELGNNVQADVSHIWMQAFGGRDVGVNDNFFEIGGDSLKATRIVAQIRKTFGVPLALRSFFSMPTIRELVEHISTHLVASPTLNHVVNVDSDPKSRYLSFPLTDIQAAYLAGRSGQLSMVDVPAFLYFEFETELLDVNRLASSWNMLVTRHEMLRTTVLPNGKQIHLPAVPYYEIKEIDVLDVGDQTGSPYNQDIRSQMATYFKSNTEWPLFSVVVSKMNESTYRLHVGIDLLIVDASSINVLASEWAQLYNDIHAPLPSKNLSFRDYVLGLKSSAYNDVSLAQRYWNDRISTLPTPAVLPLHNSALVEGNTLSFTRKSFQVSEGTYDKLKQLGARYSLTMTSILLQAYCDVIAKWNEHKSFTIASTVFLRDSIHGDVSTLVGDFTSVTLLEVHQMHALFVERARSVQTQMWADLEHSGYSGVRVLRDVQTERNDFSFVPIVFTSALGQDFKGVTSFMESLKGHLKYSVSQTPQVYLDCQVYEVGNRLTINWDYPENLFPKGLIDTMFDDYISSLSELTWTKPCAEPFTNLTNDNGSVNTCTNSDELLHDKFLRIAKIEPQRVAVKSASKTLTYGELYNLSMCLATEITKILETSGGNGNKVVAIVMDKGWEQVVAVLGTLISGNAYVPIAPHVPSKRVEDILGDADVKVVLTQSRIRTSLSLLGKCIDVDLLSSQVTPNLCTSNAVKQSPKDMAYVIYTSGSTGSPKGVMISHEGVLNTIEDINRRFNVNETDKVLALSALTFDLSVYDIFGTLSAGATIVLPSVNGNTSPDELIHLVNEHGVTIWNSVPTYMDLLLDYVRNPFEVMNQLRLVLLSGDYIPLALPGRIREKFGDPVQVVSLGGATEASIWSVLYEVSNIEPEWKTIPYGKAMHNQQVAVLDSNFNVCPIWVEGDIYIAGVGLALGYLNDPEKTRSNFLIHPVTGQRLYRTGDRGRYMSDGNIEFLGRRDFQVKIDGHRIELGEIESCLQRITGVRQAVVSAVKGRHGEKRLAAYIVFEQGFTLLHEELISQLSGILPRYALPSYVMFLDSIPVNANGKVDRTALPLPDNELTGGDKYAKSPREAQSIARIIENILCEVLGLDHVDVDQDFLSLGLTSVDMIRIANQLQFHLGRRPAITQFFKLRNMRNLIDFYSPSLTELQTSNEVSERNMPSLLTGRELQDFKRRVRQSDPHSTGVRLPQPLRFDYTPKRIRTSQRQFVSDRVEISELGLLFHSLSESVHKGEPAYRYASAGGLYPVDVYIYVTEGRIQGLRGGTYKYVRANHSLLPIQENVVLDSEIHLPNNRELYSQSAFTVFFIADMDRILPVYGEKSMDYSLIEAGLMCQLLTDASLALEIGMCSIGSVSAEQVLTSMGLHGNHELLHSVLVGKIGNEDNQVVWEEVEL